MVNNLQVLSVHTSNKCSVNCPFCYLDKSMPEKEKSHQWWLYFFQQIQNIEQIALAWNEQPIDEMCEYIKIVANKNIIVNITCNPRMINTDTAIKLKDAGVTMVSISLDRYKCKNIYDIQKPAEILKNNSLLTGVNLLLDDAIVHNLEIIVQRLISFPVDRVYALHPKPDTLQVSVEQLKEQLMTCSFLFGQKFAIDESSKLKIGKSNGCQRGMKLVSVNAYGEICLCSFDKGYQPFNGSIQSIPTETPCCPFMT